MKKFLLFLILLAFLVGCGQKVPNIPAIRISGKNYPSKGTLIYQVTDENGKPQGKETVDFQTKNNIVCVHSDVKVTTVCLDKNTFLPLSETARFMVNKAPSDVHINFLLNKIKVQIERGGKTKEFYLQKETPLYPDDILDFALQGMDFSQADVYLYDYFPYTSLKYICEVKNLGKEKIRIGKKEAEVYHIVVDFGKKHRDLYFDVKIPHLLLKRVEKNVTFTLKEFIP